MSRSLPTLQTLIILYLATSFTVAQPVNQTWPIGTSTGVSATHPALIVPSSVYRTFYGSYVLDGKLDTWNEYAAFPIQFFKRDKSSRIPVIR